MVPWNGPSQKRSIPLRKKFTTPPVGTSYTNLRHSLDNSPPPSPPRTAEFPLWVGYGFFLEQLNVAMISGMSLHSNH